MAVTLLADRDHSCHGRQWLLRLCRWALPAAFAAGALALWLTASLMVGLATLAAVVLLCPLICIALLLWEDQHVEQAIAKAVGQLKELAEKGSGER